MKRIIKKSTTITEIIVDDNGETFIIDRKHEVNNTSELVMGKEILESWKNLDQIYRQKIAKEVEDFKKKNPSLTKTEKELPDISNQKISDK